MKNRTYWWVVSAVVLSLGACNKKEEVKAPGAPVAVKETVKEPVKEPTKEAVEKPAPVTPPTPAPAVKTPAMTPEERAAKLGFVKYLPQDTEVVMSVQQGAKSVDRVKSSKFWKFVQMQMGLGEGPVGLESIDAEGIADATEPGMPAITSPVPANEPDAPVAAEPGAGTGALLGAGTGALLGAASGTVKGAEPADAPVAEPGGTESGAAVGALLGADAGAEPGAEPGAGPAGEPAGPGMLLGQEFTIALGKTAGDQAANLLTGYRRMGYFQMRMLAKAFAEAAKAGDMSSMEEALSERFGQELVKDLIADPESGVALVERLRMPPLYLAFRTTNENRAAATQQIAALIENLGQLEEGGNPVEVEKAGQKFTGQQVSGAKLAESMEEDRDEMEQMMDSATVDKLLDAVKKKNLVAVSGNLGDYVVLFIGASVDDLKLAADPGESLVASDALAFCDAYASKDLAAVIYGRKDSTDKLIAATGGLSDMVNGLRDGLAGAEALGDTRDLEALLRLVGEREIALRKLAGNEALGVTAFFDEGFKVESFGGNDNGAVDWKAANKLAPLGDSEDVVMFANMSTEAAYDEKARAYLEALFETAYAMTMKISEVKMEEGQMAEFKQMTQMFDTKFRKDAVAMWEALSGDFQGSLGRERALIVDLNGSVPAIPGIPQAVVDEGKFPRISMIAPVTDRAKLAASWEKINAATTGILAKISEMNDKEIPMQKPISSEKNGYTTWFISMPFFNDDFLPSVTVGDQWFVASTSKNQAIDLVTKAGKGGATRTGLWFTMNFKAMQKFSRETLKVVDKNADAIFGADGMPPEDLKMAGDFIDAMDDMDKLTVHVRREGGMLRTSLHFKTR